MQWLLFYVNSLAVMHSGWNGRFFPADDKEKRNKIAIPAMMEVIKALNSKIEKFLKITQMNENFCVGDSLTYADIDVFAFKLCLNDPTFNKYGDIQTSYYFEDLSSGLH